MKRGGDERGELLVDPHFACLSGPVQLCEEGPRIHPDTGLAGHLKDDIPNTYLMPPR